MAGCFVLIVQLPILLGLYRAIVATLAATPSQLLNLSGRLWVPSLSNLVPLENKFLWLNLAVPDQLYVLPILVVATTYLQQKLLMPSTPSESSGDQSQDQAAQISRQMMVMMPLMFGFFALSFASGLSIYFIASNFIGIGQYAMMGRINFKRVLGLASDDDDTDKKPAVSQTSRAASETSGSTAKTVTPKKPRRSGVYDSRASRARSKSKAKG